MSTFEAIDILLTITRSCTKSRIITREIVNIESPVDSRKIKSAVENFVLKTFPSWNISEYQSV